MCSRGQQGPVSRKSRELFGPEKPFVKLRPAYSVNCKAGLLRTFAPKSSYGEIFFISRLQLVDKVLSPKMKKKMGVTDFVSVKMAVEKCLNFDNSAIITRFSLLC